ncbi:MAG TPA: DnaJ domain-containing protein [Spirochaetales bacterium]|nr:DnaJ domain-containing protein [Spirochaetales bacterium]
MQDYYETLELGRAAGPDEIKANYRRLAMKWHPDRNPGSAAAEERFKSISEAYSVLSDASKRREYDAYLGAGGSFAGTGGARADGTWTGGSWTGGASAEGARQGSGFRWAGGAFTREEASFMFMREMYALATELTLQNVAWQDIARELVRRGCPEDVAADIARRMEAGRKAMIRERAKPYFVRSALSGFFGLGLFAAFAGVGFGLLGFLGLAMFLSGAYNLVRAFYHLATGKAPV